MTDPVVSESPEDKLRRFVFSRCLRLLSSAEHAEQRQQWFRLVETIRNAPTQKQQNAVGAKRLRADEGVVSATTDPAAASPEGVSVPAITLVESVVSDEVATASISTYLRELVDQVTGLAMSVLTAAALHVLCTMLGCVPNRTKSKDALCIALMNFYIISNPVGKRVSTNTQQQPVPALPAPKPKAKPAAKSMPSSVPLPKARAAVATSSPQAAAADDDSLLDVDMAAPAKVQRRKVLPAAASSAATTSSISPDAALDVEALARDVVTIVRCFEPITVATLTAKVVKLGSQYGDVGPQEIGGLLDRLAAKRVIFMEHGVVFYDGC
jgi:hypothetical protein